MNPLAAIVLLPLVAGTVLCAGLGRGNTPVRRALTAAAAGSVTLAALALLLSLAPQVLAGQALIAHTDWVPSLGLSIGWRLDGLALLFALLIMGIGLLIVAYAHVYLARSDPAGKFYALLMLFMAAMLGVVMSDNLMLLAVFWELTSLSSFLLVGYWGRREEARAGARMALAVTGGGGLVMLAGFVLLGQVAGTYELSQLLGRGDVIKADPLYPLLLGLILTGCFTKSAQVPFHFWLPAAMAAPTPVSAYLHSATMVKGGVFLLARLYPAIGGEDLFEGIVAGVGLATMAFAAWVAIFKHDLKALLAYSTVSHLGLITFLIGLGSPLSAVAAVFHILNHAIFKAALFMGAGIIDHATGTRDLRRLGGLHRLMPWSTACVMTAAAAMAGMPLLNGFLSKEMFFHEALGSTFFSGPAVPLIATFAGLCSMAYSVRLVHAAFFDGAPKDLPPGTQPHDPPPGMLMPVALLAMLCIAIGLFPSALCGPLIEAAAGALRGTAPPEYTLAIWHGINLPLLLGALALSGGAVLYFVLHRAFGLPGYTPRRWSGAAGFGRLIERLCACAGRLTHWIENGSLQRSLAWMVLLTLIMAALPFGTADRPPAAGTRALLPAPPLAIVVWGLLLIISAVLVRTHHHRFQAIVLTGAVGMVTALTFVALSAPDLALTQLSVEVVATVLLLMGLALLPQTSPRESTALRCGRDAALALMAGGGVAALAWLVLTRDHASMSWFFLDHALPEGGGANVVNVILVDFRGFDTFGEITVLGIAALGALALLDGLRIKRPGPAFDPPALLLRTAARIVLPLALTVSAYVFWRGHHLPGGGFIAGLITAAALVLQFMALGQARAEAVLHGEGGRRFSQWLGGGLALAGLTGAGAFVFGKPFLTSAHAHPTVALFGEVALASATLFDLGVYVAVVGATVLMLSVLGAVGKASSP
jgi:multicomponent K+:H+ antiporter subunit A